MSIPHGEQGLGNSNGDNTSTSSSCFFNWSGGGDDFSIGAAGGYSLSASPSTRPPSSSCISFSQPQQQRQQRHYQRDDSSMNQRTKKKQKTMLSSIFSNPFQNNNDHNDASRDATTNVIYDDDDGHGVDTIAHAFNQLSTQEREDALDDVHGIVNDHDDDDQHITNNDEMEDFSGGAAPAGGGGMKRNTSTDSISNMGHNKNNTEQNVNSDLESNPSQLQHVLQMMDYELVKQSLGGSSPSSSSSSSSTGMSSSSPFPPSNNNNYNTSSSITSFTATTTTGNNASNPNPTSSYRNNAYLLALQQRPEYVDDVELRMQFLRAERYNPILAATRMISFLDIKLELFGTELLTKKYITLDDLEEDDIRAMKSGFFQIIPLKDRSGRYICMAIPSMVETSRSKSYVSKNRSVLIADGTCVRGSF